MAQAPGYHKLMDVDAPIPIMPTPARGGRR